MKPLYVFFNILAILALGILLGYLTVKANGCSSFNPNIACTRYMQGDNL